MYTEMSGTKSLSSESILAWTLKVGKAHVNSYGSIHGGCTASLVSSLGSAALAAANPGQSPGVVVSMDIQYSATAPAGSLVSCAARPLGGATRDKAAASAEVRISNKRDKLVAIGTLTQCLAGA